MRIDKVGLNFFNNSSKLVQKVRTFFSGSCVNLLRQPPVDTFEVNCIKNIPGIKSKTFQKMLNPKFALDNNLAENGTRITTLFNKKTGRPVKAFVAQIQNSDKDCEKYCIMVKNKKGDINIGGEYFSNVGETYFYVNKEEKMITPKFDFMIKDGEIYQKVLSYMESYGNKKYGGIGIRLHQLRVERMLQNQLGNVCIVADGCSFPFHYAMGFRLKPEFMPIEEISELIPKLCLLNNKSAKENARFVAVGLKDNKQVIDVSKTMENLMNDYYKKSGQKPLDYSPNMYLNKTSFDQWFEMIEKNPILFDVGTFSA